MATKKRDSIPPIGASKWAWVAWWIDTLMTYAACIVITGIAWHFIAKYW